MKLLPFQQEAVDALKGRSRSALYWDMGTGKTFAGGELASLSGDSRILIVCQKSKVQDWIIHMRDNHSLPVYDLTSKRSLERWSSEGGCGVVNYDLLSRRPVFKKMSGHCLVLDESSLIQNETTKRTKVVMSMAPSHVVLLSGTPTGGRYEKLWTQMRLLGWRITKEEFWRRYIEYRIWDSPGFPVKIVTGYKRVDELKAQMREHGARFLKAEDVLGELPSQTFLTVVTPSVPEYARMDRDGISTLDGIEILGDSSLSLRMALRRIATVGKGKALSDILESTEERVVVMYSFNRELTEAKGICEDCKRAISEVNGSAHDLTAYESVENSVTLIQYQAGAMGLNLQKARIMVFMSPPESSELYEQAKKRIHRIGQSKPCLYYRLMMSGTIEADIYDCLAQRKDYTDELFREKHGTGKNIRN